MWILDFWAFGLRFGFVGGCVSSVVLYVDFIWELGTSNFFSFYFVSVRI